MANGLEGVVAASTRLSCVDGEAGRLILAGYAVEDLAPSARFEKVASAADGNCWSRAENGRKELGAPTSRIAKTWTNSANSRQARKIDSRDSLPPSKHESHSFVERCQSDRTLDRPVFGFFRRDFCCRAGEETAILTSDRRTP